MAVAKIEQRNEARACVSSLVHELDRHCGNMYRPRYKSGSNQPETALEKMIKKRRDKVTGLRECKLDTICFDAVVLLPDFSRSENLTSALAAR